MTELVDVRALPPAVAATRVWRMSSQLWVTVIVKATFSFRADREMEVTNPEPIVRVAQHVDDDRKRSLLWPSDIVPRLPHPEVVVSGAAYVEPGSIGSVRLGVYDGGGRAVVDKQLSVRAAPSSGSALARVPLGYEDAFGGAGHAENPVGRGMDGAGPRIRHPEDVGQHTARTVGLGPIAPAWPVRLELLPKALQSYVGVSILELPDELAFEFAQAAPPDQRFDRIGGDEWIVLEGMRPHGTLRSRLPGAVARARIHVDGGLHDAIDELRPDRLLIDSERERCSVTWRACFPMKSARSIATCTITAGIELPNAPILWPASPSSLSATMALNGPVLGVRRADLTTTRDAAAQPVERSLPFRSEAQAPPSPTLMRMPVPTGTVTDAWARPSVAATPFAPPASSSFTPVFALPALLEAPVPAKPWPPVVAPPEFLADYDSVVGAKPASGPVEASAPEPPSARVEAPTPSEPEPRRPVRRSTQPARVRARALTKLLTTDDADLAWFATHMTRAGSALQIRDLKRIRDILETLSDALDTLDDQARRRIDLAWELFRKDRE